MQTNPVVEQNKTLNSPGVREISPVGKEKVYGGNDLVKRCHNQMYNSLVSAAVPLIVVYVLPAW